MPSFEPVSSRPIVLTPSSESAVYGLFALALGLTVAGVAAGMTVARPLLESGWALALLFVELGIILSARWWINRSPLNYVLFAVFPLLSGFTLTPYLMMLLADYANGASILLNALGATACASLAAAVYARTTRTNLSFLGRGLFFALLGFVAFGLLQLFIPALRGTGAELLISGGGIVLFSLFLAYDVQRIQRLGRAGASPFLLALSLYLDVFNLFLSILRFMVALSGRRR